MKRTGDIDDLPRRSAVVAGLRGMALFGLWWVLVVAAVVIDVLDRPTEKDQAVTDKKMIIIGLVVATAAAVLGLVVGTILAVRGVAV